MEYEDKLFDVLRHFMEYGNYQGKTDKAVIAIQRSFPDRSKEELVEVFEQCILAYKEAIVLVKENLSHYSTKNGPVLEAETIFRKKHSQVPDQVLSWIIGWIYHWYHER